VKLLFDGNLSDRIVPRLIDLFAESTHIKAVGLDRSDDSVISDWAKQHGFTIVSKGTPTFTKEALLWDIRRSSFGCASAIARPV
jgi:predicted nuclease of predicted toxin-antitoxin system